MQNVAILGSTGSIGRQALDVVRAHPDLFRLYGVSAHSSEAAFLDILLSERPQRAVFSRPLSTAVFGVEVSEGEGALLSLAGVRESAGAANGVACAPCMLTLCTCSYFENPADERTLVYALSE